MPYATAAKNFMLDALRGTGGITHVGLLDADAVKSGTAGTDDLISIASHGYVAGDLIVFSNLVGGVGLAAGRPYFVVGTPAAGSFTVSLVPGGAVVDITTAYTGLDAKRLVELAGGSPAYARAAIAFSAAVAGTMDDSTNGAQMNVPGGATVDFISFHSASTGGTLHAIHPVTAESYASQGTYSVTDADLDLNGVTP